MADQGVSDLIKGISDDVKLLVRDEIQLAKTELVPAAKNAGIGAGLFGAAGYFAISALSVLYFAAAFALAQVVDTWLANPMRLSVALPIADTTTTTSWPSFLAATIRSATRFTCSADATDEPPYFWTTRATGPQATEPPAGGDGCVPDAGGI